MHRIGRHTHQRHHDGYSGDEFRRHVHEQLRDAQDNQRQHGADQGQGPCNDDRPGAARKNSSTARGIVLMTLGHSPGFRAFFDVMDHLQAIADTAPSTGGSRYETTVESGIRRGCPLGRYSTIFG